MLKNLDLKASALDDLDLPVKVLSGHLGEKIVVPITSPQSYKPMGGQIHMLSKQHST